MIPFLEGFGAGLLLAFIIGPVFFTLLSISLRQGVKTGIGAALGIFVSDVICVLICTYGASEFLTQNRNRYYLGILGSVLLLMFGFKYLFKPGTSSPAVVSHTNSHYYAAFAKGFLVNFANPVVFAIWLGIIGVASGKYGFGLGMGLYLSGTLTSIFITDMLKAIFAGKLSGMLHERWLIRLFRFIGLLMLVFGLRLLYYTFMEQG
ncbi:lysine transporter LysE [Sphingobacteriales bacterium UPWRP_1]|nr:hypothetical protein BVG80_10370 [Sphingobacteriales bacterium TSM_CSM]PSJ78823.1 lysine transporter LysE [Sphingobacteriales bacterium UPWRP_1]